MRLTFTSEERVHGVTATPWPGGKRVATAKTLAASARAAASLRDRTTTRPRRELAFRFGSRRSIGVDCRTAILAFLSQHWPKKGADLSHDGALTREVLDLDQGKNAIGAASILIRPAFSLEQSDIGVSFVDASRFVGYALPDRW